MMKFALLASGSKGNCFLFQEESLFLMIDCGTTKAYLQQCFEQLQLRPEDLDAVLITHNHTDHVGQIKQFKDHEIYSPVELKDIKTIPVIPEQKFQIQHVTVTPLALSHDAPNTVGYILETWQEKLVYITDTGYLKDKYLPLLKGADYIILESNHDVGMLMETSRPQFLKMRIASDSGHLCNEDAAAVLEQIVTEKTKRVILAHISQEANTREQALNTALEALKKHAGHLNPDLVISAAGQYEVLKGGAFNEKVDLGSCSSTPCMVHLSDVQPEQS
ncbi:MAG: MBL fold metallo-hydrolase [Solobacterium sp.]|nr:MBL fold metallo-hydrolase [Solobacterium sp.]MCH4222061.1 MBL fold metallo-hydrolase [Solobacterium sp.]MCH4265723.1 MBL fold metallo-hydrolase [Solobacterium sp.]